VELLYGRTEPDRSQAVLTWRYRDRGGPDVTGDLLELADQRYAPDLILFTGDAVQYGSAQEQWDDFLDYAGPVLRRVPTVLTLGNHEAGDQIFFTLWALPGDEHWFAFDYGPVHLTVLDDSTDLYPDTSGSGARFLAADLPSVALHRWRLVMHHQPTKTTSPAGLPPGSFQKTARGRLALRGGLESSLATALALVSHGTFWRSPRKVAWVSGAGVPK